ncbi:hypothetical protein C2G38_2085248 [Gigaspora rosea]|uniref:Uncharacterized protein n=1 Tax=Gigaspora rosea TaxID=44941 RepID=A0A397V9L4_9GLOM|nr:hypothetical protein C2G38_2085248 [Gigaspora rosea]
MNSEDENDDIILATLPLFHIFRMDCLNNYYFQSWFRICISKRQDRFLPYPLLLKQLNNRLY